jgi:SAM-dependent methyltransferase
MAQSKGLFNRLYGAANTPEDLPWHESKPPELLVKALDQRGLPCRALDIGCGAGTYSIYMAERGCEVTSIDFMPQAIDMLKAQLQGSELPITPVQADIGQWTTDQPFDVVLDIGCLHTPDTISLADYKRQLLNWLASGGDFILLHFGSRGWWDWWPIGPNRTPAEELKALFAPEFSLVEDRSTVRADMPWFIGRSAMIGRYWFRRN